MVNVTYKVDLSQHDYDLLMDVLDEYLEANPCYAAEPPVQVFLHSVMELRDKLRGTR